LPVLDVVVADIVYTDTVWTVNYLICDTICDLFIGYEET